MRASNFFKKLNESMEIAGGWEISRRYAVMNGFDGILTVLGIVLSTYFIGVDNPSHVIGPGFAASIAIGVSGFWIAFLTEEAEQSRERVHMESQIFTSLDDTVLAKSGKVAAVVNSIIDGASPFLLGSISLIPFVLVIVSGLPMSTAYTASFVISAVLLFVLGILLGRISLKNGYIMGLKTLLAGVIVSVLVFLLEVE